MKMFFLVGLVAVGSIVYYLWPREPTVTYTGHLVGTPVKQDTIISLYEVKEQNTYYLYRNNSYGQTEAVPQHRWDVVKHDLQVSPDLKFVSDVNEEYKLDFGKGTIYHTCEDDENSSDTLIKNRWTVNNQKVVLVGYLREDKTILVSLMGPEEKVKRYQDSWFERSLRDVFDSL